MADETLRTLARKVEANPGDDNVAASYTYALRRMGEEVPYGLRVQLTQLYTILGVNACGMAEYRHKTTGMIFVMVPAGSFEMGPPDNLTEEQDGDPIRRSVSFNEPFLMAKTPWTGRQWHLITGDFPSHFPTRQMVEAVRPEVDVDEVARHIPAIPDSIRLALSDSDGRLWGDHPVESVSWDRCREVEDQINRIDFSRQFNAPFRIDDGAPWVTWEEYEASKPELRSDSELTLPSLTPVTFPTSVESLYQAWLWNDKGERCGFQLPSEAMWEYAARAGTTTRYPNGDTEEDLEKIAWFGGDYDDGHKAVGLKEPNNWGLYDNCGNVFEWTRCLWSQSQDNEESNGFVAYGEERAVVAEDYLDDDSITRRVWSIVAKGELVVIPAPGIGPDPTQPECDSSG